MKKRLTKAEKETLLAILKERFENHCERHKKIKWKDVQARLLNSEKKMWSLNQMEITGGEPDVIKYDKKNDEYIFVDCSRETPRERRNLCYDQAALESRKRNKPKSSALEQADVMGIKLLTEKQYRKLQKRGEFDTKTSSWVETPEEIRMHGGALFCDRRYDDVFTYHNGAESYYAARGFRGSLRV